MCVVYKIKEIKRYGVASRRPARLLWVVVKLKKYSA
jgi:hypothetical protein